MNISEYVAELGKLTEHRLFGRSLNDTQRAPIACSIQNELMQNCLFTETVYTLKRSLEIDG